MNRAEIPAVGSGSLSGAELWLLTQWVMAPVGAALARQAGIVGAPEEPTLRAELARMSRERLRRS
jgi:hypothetical protein